MSFIVRKATLLVLSFLFIQVAKAVPSGPPIDSLWTVFEKGDGRDSAALNALVQLTGFYEQIKFDSAVQLSQELIAKGKNQGNKKVEMWGHFYFARFNAKRGDNAGFETELATLFQQAAQENDQLMTAKAHYLRGVALNNNGQPDSALAHYGIAIPILEKVGDRVDLASLLYNYGITLTNMGKAAEALDYCLRAAKIYQDAGDMNRLGANYRQIGYIYQVQKDTLKANDYYMRSREAYEKAGNTQEMVNIRVIEAGFLSGQAKFEEALALLKAQEPLLAAMANSRVPGNVYAQTAEILLSQDKDLPQALSYAQKSLAERLRIYTPILLSQEYFRLGKIYLKMNKGSLAQENCRQALEFAKKIQRPSDEASCLECLYRAAKMMGNYKDALAYFERKEVINDSLINESKIREMAELEAGFEYDKKLQAQQLAESQERAKADLEHQKELAAKQNRWYLTLAILAVLLVLALAIGYAYMFSRRKNAELAKQNTTIEGQNQTISKSLAEKELLLKEIHHRVKNNLQVVSGLLEMQSASVVGDENKTVFQEGQNRVKAIALIHQRLYQHETLTQVDFRDYLNQLVAEVSAVFDGGKQVVVEMDVEPITMDVDTAIPLGLIANELITNAYKYAFEATGGTLSIGLKREASFFEFSVVDDGGGLPENVDLQKTRSLGMQLVRGLTRQIKGTLAYRNNPGAEFRISF